MRTLTFEQNKVEDLLDMPAMLAYSDVSVSKSLADPKRLQMLEKENMDLALDLYTGMHLTQITADRIFNVIYCQLTDDLQIMRLDYGNGHRKEIPLYYGERIVRVRMTLPSQGTIFGLFRPVRKVYHNVVLVFKQQELEFAFQLPDEAECFAKCMDVLIRRAVELWLGGVDNSPSPVVDV